jgi:hypothetical protein
LYFLLLQEEIPAITYNSGGTYTLGALMQAVEVLQVEDENNQCIARFQL